MSGPSDAYAASDYFKDFDSASLKEISDRSALPPGIRAHVSAYPPFFIGGLGKSSAVVAYQVGDYVPTYAADAYVFENTRWIKVKSWEIVLSENPTLPQVLKAIENTNNSTVGMGLAGTLARLNLSDPIADLNRNIARDKTYFIGLCEPPGHTPGVAKADEGFVHTPNHGLWCLPGSGDVIRGDEYAAAVEQARTYSSQYNAELMRRIHRGEVP